MESHWKAIASHCCLRLIFFVEINICHDIQRKYNLFFSIIRWIKIVFLFSIIKLKINSINNDYYYTKC